MAPTQQTPPSALSSAQVGTSYAGIDQSTSVIDPPTPREIAQIQRTLKFPDLFPEEFKGWIQREMERNPPRLLNTDLAGDSGGSGAPPPDATTTSKGIVQLAGDLTGTAANPQIATAVIVDADVNAANKDGTAATPSMRTLGAGAQQAAAGNDSRLTNARTPTAHASTHQPGGSDPMAVDAAAATGSLRTLGTGSAQAAAGNDSRFTDSRTPTAHHTTHEPGGSDAMAVDAAAATGSLRTLGAGAAQAMPGNRTLDAITAPAADVSLNSKKITSLATPTVGTDACTKAYADALVPVAASGYYSSATHSAGTTITITQATHGLRSTRGLIVQVQLEADGSILIADVTVGATGTVTVTFNASQAANTIRVTLIG